MNTKNLINFIPFILQLIVIKSLKIYYYIYIIFNLICCVLLLNKMFKVLNIFFFFFFSNNLFNTQFAMAIDFFVIRNFISIYKIKKKIYSKLCIV